jgi:Ser/Thr protein kinase RdoA (MazF antagonist)
MEQINCIFFIKNFRRSYRILRTYSEKTKTQVRTEIEIQFMKDLEK